MAEATVEPEYFYLSTPDSRYISKAGQHLALTKRKSSSKSLAFFIADGSKLMAGKDALAAHAHRNDNADRHRLITPWFGGKDTEWTIAVSNQSATFQIQEKYLAVVNRKIQLSRAPYKWKLTPVTDSNNEVARGDSGKTITKVATCKATACAKSHKRHKCSMCGDKDADHTSPFCYKFCTPGIRGIPSNHCLAPGCMKDNCLSHKCNACGNENSDHLSINCPIPKSLEASQIQCKIANCRAVHNKHSCCVCKQKDADHRSMDCEEGTVLFHQTRESAIALIMMSRSMLPGTEGACGPGIYFASQPKYTAGKAHNFGFMIEARVWLGKQYVVHHSERNLKENKVIKAGCDSIHCIRDPKKRWKDEWVVHNWKRASIISIFPCHANGQPLARLPSLLQLGDFPRDIVLKDNLSDPHFTEAANYVYNKFLRHAYKDRKHEYHPTPSITVQRPNHGLAHTIRVASYLPMVVATSGIDFPPEDMLKCQIALLFYVSGRESEADSFSNAKQYNSYRKASSKRYAGYSKQQGWTDTERFEEAILAPHSSAKDDTVPGLRNVRHVMLICHELDMLRCRKEEVYDDLVLTLAKRFGLDHPIENSILRWWKGRAHHAVTATGDQSYKKDERAAKRFNSCSTSCSRCVEMIRI